MFQSINSSVRRRLAWVGMIVSVGMALTGLMPAATNAADPAVYTLESSAERICTVEVGAERRGGILVLRRIEFKSVVTCDSVAGTDSPGVGGGALQLYSTQTEQLPVVLASGERSQGFGYFCETVDSTPCVDQGEFPLSLPGDYFALSNFTIFVPEGETWTDMPAGCESFSPETVTCALRSNTLHVGLLR